MTGKSPSIFAAQYLNVFTSAARQSQLSPRINKAELIAGKRIMLDALGNHGFGPGRYATKEDLLHWMLKFGDELFEMAAKVYDFDKERNELLHQIDTMEEKILALEDMVDEDDET